jgi:hypothetical protein
LNIKTALQEENTFEVDAFDGSLRLGVYGSNVVLVYPYKWRESK